MRTCVCCRDEKLRVLLGMDKIVILSTPFKIKNLVKNRKIGETLCLLVHLV